MVKKKTNVWIVSIIIGILFLGFVGYLFFDKVFPQTIETTFEDFKSTCIRTGGEIFETRDMDYTVCDCSKKFPNFVEMYKDIKFKTDYVGCIIAN